MRSAHPRFNPPRTAAILIFGFCLAVLFGWAAPAWSDAAPSPVAVWATEGGESHIQIDACGAQLCGKVVWLKEPLAPNNQEKTDFYNPDPTLRSRKIVGLEILSSFVQDKDDAKVWREGKIYNPKDGKTYSCKLTMLDADTLRVRGYVGIALFGKTQTWTRVK